jgi:hypothetical protein
VGGSVRRRHSGRRHRQRRSCRHRDGNLTSHSRKR